MNNSDYYDAYKNGMSDDEFILKYLKPAIYRGEELEDYYVDQDGDIWSTKRYGYPQTLSPTVSGNTEYPRVGLMIDGERKTIQVHSIVCETFHKKPFPDILNKKQWAAIDEEVREILIEHLTHADRFQVNHIDHNQRNYHPSNLEWVTQRENIQKYQKYSRNI